MVKDLKIKLTKLAEMRNRGIGLTEVLVVTSILIIIATTMVGSLNPIALVNKAQDSRRKNDLKEIKIAFENYYNDKGSYPPQEKINSWNVSSNCNTVISEISSYLKKWRCGPHNTPYKIEISVDGNSYRAVTNLDNKKDKDIPEGWYEPGTYPNYGEKNTANYGVSSSNILWYGDVLLSCRGLDCISVAQGVTKVITDDVCNTDENEGIQCYRGYAQEVCKVSSCCGGSGCRP